jgi:hypothetical protein
MQLSAELRHYPQWIYRSATAGFAYSHLRTQENLTWKNQPRNWTNVLDTARKLKGGGFDGYFGG